MKFKKLIISLIICIISTGCFAAEDVPSSDNPIPSVLRSVPKRDPFWSNANIYPGTAVVSLLIGKEGTQGKLSHAMIVIVGWGTAATGQKKNCFSRSIPKINSDDFPEILIDGVNKFEIDKFTQRIQDQHLPEEITQTRQRIKLLELSLHEIKSTYGEYAQSESSRLTEARIDTYINLGKLYKKLKENSNYKSDESFKKALKVLDECTDKVGRYEEFRKVCMDNFEDNNDEKLYVIGFDLRKKPKLGKKEDYSPLGEREIHVLSYESVQNIYNRRKMMDGKPIYENACSRLIFYEDAKEIMNKAFKNQSSDAKASCGCCYSLFGSFYGACGDNCATYAEKLLRRSHISFDRFEYVYFVPNLYPVLVSSIGSLDKRARRNKYNRQSRLIERTGERPLEWYEKIIARFN